MKNTKLTCSVAALFYIMLVVPVVLNSNLVDSPGHSIENTTASIVVPTEESAVVFVDPDKIVKDYLLNPDFQIGNTFQIHVNISDVTNLFAWNVNATWNPAILNFTKLESYGDFLAQTTSPNGTSRIWDIINANNETGYAAIGETTLGDYPGVNGSGRLLTAEFLIVGYGSTDLTVSVNGASPTELVDSNIDGISFTVIDGYFSNKVGGDVDGDGDVDPDDFAMFAGAYGTTPPSNPECDLDRDGDIDPDDFAIFAGNYGKAI